MNVEEKIKARLQKIYLQRADVRQAAMGLSYTEAETTDLARNMASLFDQLFAERINQMIGYVQNGTSTDLVIFQDDATMTYWVKIGRRSFHHRSLLCVLQDGLTACQDLPGEPA